MIGRDTDIVKIRDLVDRLKKDKKRYKQEILDLKSDTRTLEYTENNLRNELLLISTEKQELNEKLTDLIRENEEVISKYSNGENTLTQLNQQRTYLIKYTKELTDKLNQHDQKSKEILQKQTTNSEKIIELKDKRIHELASVIMKNVNTHTADMEKLKTELEHIHEKEKSEIESKFSTVIRNLTSNSVLAKNTLMNVKEESKDQLNTLRKEYENKLKSTTEKLKSNWSSDVIEQRKESNKIILKQKSDIVELNIKLENYTKLYEEYVEKYNNIIKEKSKDIVEYKTEIDKTFDDRLQQEIEKIKRQYETNNDIKKMNDEIEGYKKQIVQLKQTMIYTNTDITNTKKKFNEYKDNTDNIILKLNEDIKKIQSKREKDSIHSSKQTQIIRDNCNKKITEHKMQISELETTIESLHNYKNELDKIRNDEQQLKEKLNLTKLIVVNEREKFKREYQELIDKNKKEIDNMNKHISTKDNQIDTYKKKLLVYHDENNTIKSNLEQQITKMKTEHEELTNQIQSSEKTNNLLVSEIKRNKESFNKQLSILEKYKDDNDNGISYIKEKLSETEKELEKYKTMSQDLHQRLLVRSDEFNRTKNRVVDLENLLENTVKKFTNN